MKEKVEKTRRETPNDGITSNSFDSSTNAEPRKSMSSARKLFIVYTITQHRVSRSFRPREISRRRWRIRVLSSSLFRRSALIAILRIHVEFSTQYLAADSPEIVAQFTDGAGSCGSPLANPPLEEHRGSTSLVCILGFSIDPPMVS